MSSDRRALHEFAQGLKGPRPEPTRRESTVALVRDDPPPAMQQLDVAEAPDEPIHNVSAHLPASLRVTAFEAARARGISITELLFAALDEVLDPAATPALDLHQQMTRHRSGMPASRRRQRGGEGTVQVQLRLTQTQKVWLEERAVAHGAANRSAFVTAVFRRYLGR